MKELKLLDLSDVHLSPLPLSLKDLENLQTLCLDRCVLKEIATIGKLKKLQVLSFIGSTISQLPKQLENLTRLRLLDLKRCQKLEVIPAGVLSCLIRLEELYMGDSFVQWGEEGHVGTSNNANLGELKLLSNLAILEMQVIDPKAWPDDMSLEKLDKFKIFIGENWRWSGKYETSKTLKLQINTNIQLRRVKGLFKSGHDVYLDDMKGVKCVLYDLDAQGFPEMKHLNVRNSPDIQYILDSMSMNSSNAAFPKLESLALDYLVSLEKICRGAIKAESFIRLRKLNVSNCDRLKNLFSFSMARSLVQLGEINASSCKIMEELVIKENEDNSSNDEEIDLRQLCSLTLENLPRLTRFNSLLKLQSAATNTASSAEIVSVNEPETPAPLFNKKITFPNLADLKLISIKMEKIWSKQLMVHSQCIQNLATLIVDGCENLNYLFTPCMIHGLVQLKKLEISSCESMDEVIATLRPGEETMGYIYFPKLEFLMLKHLPKLITFCTGNLLQCPSLKMVHIECCHQLKTFISDFTGCSGQTNSMLFNQKVAFPKLERLNVKYMNQLTMIWHNEFEANSLKVLMIEHAEKLLKLCPSKGFQNLESLVVNNCDLLEHVFDDLEAAPAQLRTLDLKNLPNLKHVWKWNEDPYQTVSFGKLRSVIVWTCQKLKYLFPVSIAMNLKGLELLYIAACGLEFIVFDEEITEATRRFEFPRLKTFELWNLHDLNSFYSGVHTLNCATLQKLIVYHCNRLKIFDLQQENLQETEPSRPAFQVPQPLLSCRELASSLVELGLSCKDSSMIQQSQFPANLFDKLKILQLQCFYDTTASFPFRLLHIFQKVDHLVLMHCYFKEVFPFGVPGELDEHSNALARIRFLGLAFLPEIRHIWGPESQPGQVLQNLQTLQIWCCHGLVNLAPCFTSFHNLRILDVWACEGLINLLTTATAKGMVNLTVMTVRGCKSVTEIVANEGNECRSPSEIIFYKLISVKLHNLCSLTSFSASKSCTVKFPSLEEVVVTQCAKMKVFSQGIVSSPKLQKVHLTDEMKKWRWVGDLNTTIKHLYEEMNPQTSAQE